LNPAKLLTERIDASIQDPERKRLFGKLRVVLSNGEGRRQRAGAAFAPKALRRASPKLGASQMSEGRGPRANQ
jgi:hypothetical protein